jgi:ATP-dependent RNA helicase DeaD
MLDAGFAPDIERILAMTPPTRQMALFTATLPEWTIRIAGRYLHDPVLVEVSAGKNRPAPAIAQTVYVVPQGQRLDALKALLDRRDDSGVTLVFGRTKHGVKKLASQLAAQGYPVAALQGNMSQSARDRVVADFRAGQVPVLLATNVAARGLDVVAIDQVINYELPESAELFTHRIGRTGRMDREGVAITLITPEDMPAWKKIQRDLSGRLQPQPWPHDAMPLPDGPEHAGNHRAGAIEQTAPVRRPVPIHNPHNPHSRMSAHADNSSDSTRIARRRSRHSASMDRKRAPARYATGDTVR